MLGGLGSGEIDLAPNGTEPVQRPDCQLYDLMV